MEVWELICQESGISEEIMLHLFLCSCVLVFLCSFVLLFFCSFVPFASFVSSVANNDGCLLVLGYHVWHPDFV